MAKKKILSRGEKISLGLKKYHAERKAFEKAFQLQFEKEKRAIYKKLNARPAPKRKPSKKSSGRKSKTSRSTFTVKRKRTKVKSFPKKDSKNFFLSDKRYYELDVPLIIENETQARAIAGELENVREGMKEDVMKEAKNRLINIGYDISLTFNSKDKNPKKTVNIDKVCYIPSVIIQSKKDFDSAFTLLQSEIRERFIKYFGKTGFGGEIGIRGFETEISTEEVEGF